MGQLSLVSGQWLLVSPANYGVEICKKRRRVSHKESGVSGQWSVVSGH